MISYELAEKLNKAGFPFKEAKVDGVEVISSAMMVKFGLGNGPFYYLPTLSQLIDACGTRFVGVRNWQRELKRYGNNPEESNNPWIADSCVVMPGDEGTISWQAARGSDSDEAVANLYLALNSHDK